MILTKDYNRKIKHIENAPYLSTLALLKINLMNKIKTLILFSIFGITTFAQKPFFKGDNGLWGVKNVTTDEVIVEPIYENYEGFSKGFAMFSLNKKYGIVDSNGKIIIPFEFDRIYCCINEYGYVKVELNSKEGFVKKNGKVAIPIIYDRVYLFNNGRARAVLNGKTIYINKKGKEVSK